MKKKTNKNLSFHFFFAEKKENILFTFQIFKKAKKKIQKQFGIFSSLAGFFEVYNLPENEFQNVFW